MVPGILPSQLGIASTGPNYTQTLFVKRPCYISNSHNGYHEYNTDHGCCNKVRWDIAALCLSLWPAANSTQMLTLVSTTIDQIRDSLICQLTANSDVDPLLRMSLHRSLTEMCNNPLLVFMLFHCGSRHSTKPAWDCVYWANLHPNKVRSAHKSYRLCCRVIMSVAIQVPLQQHRRSTSFATLMVPVAAASPVAS